MFILYPPVPFVREIDGIAPGCKFGMDAVVWLTVGANGSPYVVWADTRGLNGNVEEDVYFAPPQ